MNRYKPQKKVIEKSEYDLQADKFLKDTGAEIECTYTGHRPYFVDDKEYRATFNVTIKRGDKSMSFEYGNSIVDSWRVGDFYSGTHSSAFSARMPVKGNLSKYMSYIVVKNALKSGIEVPAGNLQVHKDMTAPSNYSILVCLDGCDPGTHGEFCSNFGYDTDSIKARDIYLKCQKQYSDLTRLFTAEELEQLQEIQ